MTSGIETFLFKAETKQLLDIVIHSMYANRDVFLRELISNGADALAKLRLEAYRDKDLEADTGDLHIMIELDEEQRTLTITDNGIGMSHDEVVDFVGTIARSGTAELPQAEDRSEVFIGRFGVGFYSTFMVADSVVLATRRVGAEGGVRWRSTGDGEYTIEHVNNLPQGTSVTLHLRPDAGDPEPYSVYLADWKIREVVRRYSDFLPWPIRLVSTSEDDEGATARDVEAINSMTALWSRPRAEVTEAEYNELYHHITHDWAEPLATITFKAEGSLQYDAVLYLPPRAPYDMFHRDGTYGLQLYVRRVHVLDNCDALLPDYLRFIKGIVDAQDLSLNVSREMLQQDHRLHAIRRRLTKKILASLKEIMTGEPERYGTIWQEYGQVLKEGLLNDYDNREALIEILQFQSTHHSSERTTLRQYVDRMPDDQEAIYYLIGESRATAENSPHLEALREKGYEALLLSESIDSYIIGALPEFGGKPLLSAASGEREPEKTVEDGESAPPKAAQDHFDDLLKKMGTVLGDQVKAVRLSDRLTTSAARVVTDPDNAFVGWPGRDADAVRRSRTLELNPQHELVARLHAAVGASSGEPSADLVEMIQLLHAVALIADGADLDDPARFARVVSGRLARTL